MVHDPDRFASPRPETPSAMLVAAALASWGMALRSMVARLAPRVAHNVQVEHVATPKGPRPRTFGMRPPKAEPRCTRERGVHAQKTSMRGFRRGLAKHGRPGTNPEFLREVTKR